MAKTSTQKREKYPIWESSPDLSPRVKKLREEYWSYDTRDYFRNEVIPYTTGAPWDSVYSPHERTIVPEFVVGLDSVQDTLLAFAKKVDLPDDFWGEPIVVRHALFFEKVLEHHPIFILDGELIIGGHFATSFSNCLNEEESKTWRKEEDVFFAGVKNMIRLGVLNCGAVQGHIIPDHPSILKGGFAEVEKRAREIFEESFGDQQRIFAKAIMICCRAVQKFAERHARLAEKMAARERDDGRQQELLTLATICRQVPYQPARTFHEALQSLWFQHMLVLMAESYPGPGVSYGRMDQYLFPYYEKDLKEGRITRQWAKELFGCFDIKHNYAYDHFGSAGGRQGITAGDGQLITLGGMGPQGKDLTNDLTYLILEVNEEINMLEPKINVRLHANTPDDFLQCLIGQVSRAQGAPFLLNFDSMAITALENAGISHEEAVNYGVVGCLENTSQGNDRSGTVDININMAKPVEWTLFQGKDVLTGEQTGLATADPLSMESFVEFKAAYLKQLQHLLQMAVDLYNQADGLRARYEPVPYLSTMVQGCLESGRDVTQGGAKYNFVTVEGVGVATAADSLIAVKKLVFEDRKVTMAGLLQAIRDNFEGHEKLRLCLMNQAPKFGNDDPQADPRCPGDLSVLVPGSGELPHPENRPAFPRRLSFLELLYFFCPAHGGNAGRAKAGGIPLQRGRPHPRHGSQRANCSLYIRGQPGTRYRGQWRLLYPQFQSLQSQGQRTPGEVCRPAPYLRKTGRHSHADQYGEPRHASGGSKAPGEIPEPHGPGDGVQCLFHHDRESSPG